MKGVAGVIAVAGRVVVVSDLARRAVTGLLEVGGGLGANRLRVLVRQAKMGSMPHGMEESGARTGGGGGASRGLGA